MSLVRTLRKHARTIRWISVAIIVAAVLVSMRALPIGRLFGRIDRLILDLGTLGILAYGALYVVGTLLLVPGSVLTIGAGALFGHGSAPRWSRSPRPPPQSSPLSSLGFSPAQRLRRPPGGTGV